jgi:hypothetical protein
MHSYDDQGWCGTNSLKESVEQFEQAIPMLARKTDLRPPPRVNNNRVRSLFV